MPTCRQREIHRQVALGGLKGEPGGVHSLFEVYQRSLFISVRCPRGKCLVERQKLGI
jgi:hypothetical protein